MQAAMAGRDTGRELIEKARSGDREAFDELARPLTGRLLERIRLRMGRGLRETLEAEDVLQETLVRAFRSMPALPVAGGRLVRAVARRDRRALHPPLGEDPPPPERARS